MPSLRISRVETHCMRLYTSKIPCHFAMPSLRISRVETHCMRLIRCIFCGDAISKETHAMRLYRYPNANKYTSLDRKREASGLHILTVLKLCVKFCLN
jgi:hypothetical protein